jgi:ribonuclease BN (tRNA processing enzyme)
VSVRAESCSHIAGERHGLLQQHCTDSTARDSGIAKVGKNPVLPVRVQRWRILPLSLHLPVASTDGSTTRKANEIRVVSPLQRPALRSRALQTHRHDLREPGRNRRTLERHHDREWVGLSAFNYKDVESGMSTVLNRTGVGLTLVIALASSLGQTAPPIPKGQGAKAIVLGVGSPVIGPNRSGTSVGIVAGGTLYIFDAGPGVDRRVLEAAPQMSKLEVQQFGPVFITHLHLDHTLGLAALYRYHEFSRSSVLVMGNTPLVVYGPPGISSMMAHIAEAFAPLNADTRAALKVRANELTSPAVAYKDANVTVRVFSVLHKDGPAFGYRIETADRVIVVSGDTRPADAVVDACSGCDILFHEVFGLSFGPEGPAAGTPSEGHTSAAELGDVARRARPKNLVLYHTLGGSPEVLVSEIRKTFTGSVTYARDLDIF